MANGSQNMVSDKARQAFYLQAPDEAGGHTDQYGNLLHNRGTNAASDSWNIKNFNGTSVVRVYWETGEIDGIGTHSITLPNGSQGEFYAIRGNVGVWMGIGSGNTNHGLYSDVKGDWMIYANSSGSVQVNGNAATATALTSNAGGTEQPIYFTGGKPVATSYALRATVNNSTAGYFAYYSGAREISGTSNVRLTDGCLNLYPSSGSYREGIRIYPKSSWTTIVLGGNDLSATSGTSTDSWSIHNNNGNFYITRNGSSTGTSLFGCVGNVWRLYTNADMPEGAANISGACAGAHYMTIYRNAILIPYQMDNTNDGGFFRVRGASESTCIAEIGTWDDSGAGETIQFNYYPTTSQVTPTYSVTVPKKSGTIALTSDLTWDSIASKPATATRWPSWSEVTSKPNRAGSDSDGGPAQTVKGAYTSNGGKQNPNYFGTNKVGFLMMNTTVNSNSHYKDWIIMDCYSGNDVGGGVAFGVNRQALGAYIMRSAAARTSWAESAELIGTHNYTSYTVTKTGSGASGTWGINVTGSAGSATYASSYLASRTTVSGSSHSAALKTYFDNNKSTIPRNCLQTVYSSAYSNGSQYFGYFLSGYDSNPYGGFFVAHYNAAYYVGISNGTYTENRIVFDSGSWSISVTGSSGSCTGNAATATNVAWTGITSNPGIYANDATSHGNVKVTTSRGGYYGINFGGSKDCMTAMSSGEHSGLYTQNKRWLFYYQLSNDHIVIGDSGHASGWLINLAGNTYCYGAFYSGDIRGNCVRLVDNWIGFYQSANAGNNRYGYIQTNADRMYFRKENGVSTYAFDFNGHIYTSSSLTTNNIINLSTSTYGDARCQIKISSNRTFGMHLGSGGVNRGLYDWTNNHWFLYYDDNNTSMQAKGGWRVAIQTDGNLVVYNGNTAYWSAKHGKHRTDY